MVTQRDTQRRAQPQGQKEQELRMRPASRQLIGVPDPRPQPPAEFIPREFLPVLRAAAQAAPQAAPQAEPQAAPQAVAPQAAAPNTQLTGNPNVPRGYRNNNPLNIIDGSFVRGQPGYKGTDGRFGQFASMDDGIKAADNLLQSYGERGLNTPQSIIARWAPAGDGDNNPSAYAATVARNLGVEPGATIDMANPAVRRQLIDAMATVENGRPMAPPIAPPKLADGGLIELARKYADGGSVSRAAQVYDPAVIAAIAASITEPQGYADGGTATGISSDDAAPAQEQERVQEQRPRTFADLVRRYAVGDAMQMAAPLDDPSLGANVSQSIGDYFRPIVQGNFEVPGTVKKYAIDVATGPKPFTRLGKDIGTFGSAVWEGVKNDPVGTALDFVPVVSNVRSAMDMHESRNRAVEAEQAGDEDLASMYRQFSAFGAAGAIPFVGYGAIAARRAANAARDAAARRAGAGAGTALVVRGGVDDIDIGSGVGLIAREDAAAGARGTQAIAREGAEGVTAGTDVVADVVAREGVGLEPSGSAARRAKAAARESAQAVAVVPRELSPLGFYSHGAETAANLAQAKGTPDQMAAMLRKYGVKPDEFYNTGIADETATNVMRSKIERDYAPKLAAAKLEMDALGLNENTINKKSPDYNRALEIRDSPETKAKYQYDRTLSAMRSEMDSAMVLRPEWASRPSVTREELAQHFSERRPQIEETVLGGRGKPEMNDAAKQKWIEDAAAQGAYHSGDLDEIRNWRNVSDDVRTWHLDNATSAFNEQMAISPAFASQFQTIGKEGATKFQQYTLPGGENYREVLLRLDRPQAKVVDLEVDRRLGSGGGRWGVQMPDGTITSRFYEKFDAEQALRFDAAKQGVTFTSSHWDDPNVLAHLRMSDRTGPNGEKILHLEELQSDWGKKGRKEGFVDPKALAQWEIDEAAAYKVLFGAQRQHAEVVDRIRFNGEPLEPFNRGVESPRAFERREAEHFNKREALLSADPNYQASRERLDAAKDAIRALGPKPTDSGTPSAPYVTNTAAWTDLALKRALKEAAEGGYDKIVWTPGAEQVKRYDLSKQIDELAYWRADGKIGLSASGPDGTVFDQRYVSEKDLPNVVGRELAEEILKGKGSPKSTTGFPEEIGVNFISGEGLRVGGEGMKAYYDKMVPNQLSKLVKRLDPDAKVGLTDVMLPQGTGPGMGHNNPPFEAPGLTITPKMREAIMKGQTDFAEGGHVQGYADGGSADNSLAALYEKYYGGPTARQRPPTYEEMGNNPVGWSSVYPPQYMSNQDPNVSPVASRTLMSDAQRLGLLGRRGPVTGADLPALEERGQGLMDNAMTVAGAVNPVGIRAFHSSPHKFDQFDMSKIGTGEGAQINGYGLYVSDSPAVSGRGGNYDKQFTARAMGKVRLNQDEGRILTMLGEGQSELNILRDLAKNGLSFDEANSLLNRVQSAKSNIYEVNLNTSLERLLDRNKSLREQPQGVQKALRSGDIAKIQTFMSQDSGRYLAPNRAETMNLYKDAGIDGIRYIDPSSRTLGNPSIEKLSPDSFGNVYWQVNSGTAGGAKWFDSEKNAQKHYDSLPLPRYNYVMFDDKLIDLLRRYGLLGMVGGGAAAAGNKNKQAPAEEQTDYAQGGSVDSAPVYDPAVIAAIAASITEDNYA